jgi:hypothetical protein
MTSAVVYGPPAARDRVPLAVPVVLLPAIMLSRLYRGARYPAALRAGGVGIALPLWRSLWNARGRS